MLRDRSVRLADAAIATLLPMLLVGLMAWRRGAGALVAIVARRARLGGAQRRRLRQRDLAERGAADDRGRAAGDAFGAVQIWLDRRRARHFASQSKLLQHVQAPGLGHGWRRTPISCPSRCARTRRSCSSTFRASPGLSERLGPNAVRELLNGFYRLVDEEAMASGGAITSFMGDGAMVLFGLPQSAPHDAFNAAACCVGLSRRTTAWLAAQPASISVADRLQARRAFRRHRCIAARRQEPADHHHGRYGQCGKPADGGRRRLRRRTRRQRRYARSAPAPNARSTRKAC